MKRTKLTDLTEMDKIDIGEIRRVFFMNPDGVHITLFYEDISHNKLAKAIFTKLYKEAESGKLFTKKDDKYTIRFKLQELIDDGFAEDMKQAHEVFVRVADKLQKIYIDIEYNTGELICLAPFQGSRSVTAANNRANGLDLGFITINTFDWRFIKPYLLPDSATDGNEN